MGLHGERVMLSLNFLKHGADLDYCDEAYSLTGLIQKVPLTLCLPGQITTEKLDGYPLIKKSICFERYTPVSHQAAVNDYFIPDHHSSHNVATVAHLLLCPLASFMALSADIPRIWITRVSSYEVRQSSPTITLPEVTFSSYQPDLQHHAKSTHCRKQRDVGLVRLPINASYKVCEYQLKLLNPQHCHTLSNFKVPGTDI